MSVDGGSGDLVAVSLVDRARLACQHRLVDRGPTLHHDPVDGEGPLAGLHEGLLAVAAADTALAIGGDMPKVKPEVLRQMLEVLAETGAPAVAIEGEGRARPLPMAVRTWPAAEAAHTLLHAGARRLRDLLDVLRTEVLDESRWRAWDPDGLSLMDVDTPSDMPR